MKRIGYTVASTFLGRMCFSGDVTELSAEQWKAIEDGMAFYKKAAVGVDIIYNPGETMFMKLIKAQGKKAYNGLKMLLYQGVSAYELWNDCKITKEEADEVYKCLQKELGINE